MKFLQKCSLIILFVLVLTLNENFINGKKLDTMNSLNSNSNNSILKNTENSEDKQFIQNLVPPVVPIVTDPALPFYVSFAKLANCPQKTIKNLSCSFCDKLIGYTTYYVHSIKDDLGRKFQFSILYNDLRKEVVVAFSGPNSEQGEFFNSLYTRGFSILPELKNTGVETGYWLVYTQFIRSELINKLENLKISNRGLYRFIFIGHSFGGSIAVLSSLDISLKGVLPSKPVVYTYGQLRIGDLNFVNLVNSHLQIVKVIKHDDFLTRIPNCLFIDGSYRCSPDPALMASRLPGIGNYFGGYAHGGLLAANNQLLQSTAFGPQANLYTNYSAQITPPIFQDTSREIIPQPLVNAGPMTGGNNYNVNSSNSNSNNDNSGYGNPGQPGPSGKGHYTTPSTIQERKDANSNNSNSNNNNRNNLNIKNNNESEISYRKPQITSSLNNMSKNMNSENNNSSSNTNNTGTVISTGNTSSTSNASSTSNSNNNKRIEDAKIEPDVVNKSFLEMEITEENKKDKNYNKEGIVVTGTTMVGNRQVDTVSQTNPLPFAAPIVTAAGFVSTAPPHTLFHSSQNNLTTPRGSALFQSSIPLLPEQVGVLNGRPSRVMGMTEQTPLNMVSPLMNPMVSTFYTQPYGVEFFIDKNTDVLSACGYVSGIPSCERNIFMPPKINVNAHKFYFNTNVEFCR
jgi:hypothetical protein